MANNLTGDYHAVVEVRVKTINGILATLHQNGLSKDASPIFLHSFATRVGDTPKILIPSVSQLAGWMGQIGFPPPGGNQEAYEKFVKKSPPGASAALDSAVKDAHAAQMELTVPGAVRGTAQVQLSTPTVTFPAGTTSEVTARVEMRANYVPDPDTLPLPEPVHGNVEVTFTVGPAVSNGIDVLAVHIPSDASKIRFTPAPGAGLTTSQASTIEQHVRKALREGFQPIQVELPAGFQFNRFKALGSGAGQAVALPVQLGGGPAPPPPAINSLSNVFLESGDQFAVGISKEYILSLVQPSLDAIKASHPQFTVSGLLGSATYTTTFTLASATWQSGKIRLQIQGKSTNPKWWAPNVNFFGITQDLALQLDASAQKIDVVPLGDPAVSVSVGGPLGGLIEGLVKPMVTNAFVSRRDTAIAAAESQIQQVLSGSGSVENGLEAFDDSAQARYTVLDPSADGIVLRGRITTKARYQVAAQFTETGGGTGFTALKSWIPAGAIDRFEWSWLENATPYIPWSGTVKSVHDAHRFVVPKPAGVSFTSQMCLHVKGRVTYPGSPIGPQVVTIGDELPAEGGENCQSRASGPSFVWVMPSWWDRIMVPIWQPDPPPEMILDQAISAHVNVLSDPGGARAGGASAIIHFADLGGAKPFDALDGPLSAYSGRGIPMALVLVVPRGAFAGRRAAVEARLGELRRFSGAVVITEDYEQGWSRTFGVEGMPATYLMNARGEFVWGRAGELDSRGFTEALERTLLAGPGPELRRVRLRFQVGDRAPDVVINGLDGGRMALRRLRGRRVLLNFWQSWSAPCVRELDSLGQRQSRAGRDGLVVVAINGGESREKIDAFRHEQPLGVMLASDPEQRIARAYGVSCWPTTVSITEAGIVDGIQFGLSETESRSPAGGRPAA